MDRFPTKKSLPDEEDVDDNLIIEQNKNQRKKRQAPYLIFPEILCIIDYDGYRYILDILFRQITTFFKVRVAFVLGLQTPYLIYFSKIYPLKSLRPKNKGHANFYKCSDLTNKYYLIIFYNFNYDQKSCCRLCS